MRLAIFPLTWGQIAPNVRGMNLHAQVIRAAGGRTYLAGVLRLPPETVKSWPRRGIPARYWHHVIGLVSAKLPDVTIDDLERTRPASDGASSGEAA